MRLKVIIIMAVAVLAALPTANILAQEPEDYIFFRLSTGNVLRYKVMDGNGDIIAFSCDSTVEISGDALDGRATVLTTMTFPDGSPSAAMYEYLLFKNGEVIQDLGRIIEESIKGITDRYTLSGECLGIPSDINMGVKLPSYTITLKTDSKMTDRRITVKHRKVTDWEILYLRDLGRQVTSFVVEETFITKSYGITEKTVQKSWYTRQLGLVKREIRDINKEILVSTSELISYTLR